MERPEVVLVAGFDVPPESMLRGGPEHKIQYGFTADRVRRHAKFFRMHPLGTNAYHKVHFFRERPRLLEEQVDIPFGRVPAEKRRDSRLKFQPLVYRRKFNRRRRAEARAAAFDIPIRRSTKLHNRGWLLLHRLRESVCGAEKQRY